MWLTEDDARAGADWLIEESANVGMSLRSSRELQLTRLAAYIAMEKVRLGQYHPFALVFSEQLRERVDAPTYRELSKAVADAENSLISSRPLRWRSERFAG